MTNQAVIAQVGIGLAYGVFENEMPPIQSADLTWADLKSIFNAARSYERRIEIIELMIPKAVSFKKFLWLLEASRTLGGVRIAVFRRCIALGPTYTQLKHLLDQTHSDEAQIKIVIKEHMEGMASTFEELFDLLGRTIGDPNSALVFAAAAKRVETLDELKRLIRIGCGSRLDEEPLVRVFESMQLSFGELYSLYMDIHFASRFNDAARSRLETMQVSADDVIAVFNTHSQGVGMGEMIAEKVRSADFSLDELRRIYEHTQCRFWREVDEVVTEKIRSKVTALLPSS